MEYNMMEWDLYTADKIVEQSMDPENGENPNVATVTYSNRSPLINGFLKTEVTTV